MPDRDSDPGADGRRRRRTRQRRRVAAREPPRPRRCRIRHQRRHRRRRAARRQDDRARRAGSREGLCVVLADGEEPGRTQLASDQGERDLSARGRVAASRRVRVPGPPDRHHPHLLRAHGAHCPAPPPRTCAPSRGRRPTCAAAARLASKSPFHNALLRTTCVATMLQGGHAENALPQTAQATVNCRLPPDEDAARRAADAGHACSPIRRSSWRRSARRRRARPRRSRQSL